LVALMMIGAMAQSQAQEGFEVGGWAGASYYYGDLKTTVDLSNPNLAFGMLARYNFNERVCLALSGNYGKVAANDADSNNPYEQARNLSFESEIVDAALRLEFNFLELKHGSKDQFFSPYLFGGLSAFYYNPKTEYNGQLVELRPLGTEGQFKGEEYYSISGGWAFGMGIKVDLSYRWSLNFEVDGRRLFTDYLDDVSTTYADADDIEGLRGEVAVALADRSIDIPGVDTANFGIAGKQRGDSQSNDIYAFGKISLVYYFGDLKCPPISGR